MIFFTCISFDSSPYKVKERTHNKQFFLFRIVTKMTEYKPSSWNLNDLFPSIKSNEINKALQMIEENAEDIKSYRDKLSSSMDTQVFLELMDKREKTTRLTGRIGQFAGLSFSENTQNPDTQAFQAKVQGFMAKIWNDTMFFDLWFKQLSEDEVKRFLDIAGEYKHNLSEIRKFKPYTLSEAEEKIINTKNVTGVDTIRRLYNTITNKYVFGVEVEGEMKKISRGELMSLVQSPDPDLRARAYQELYRIFREDGPLLGQMYQSIVKDFGNEKLDMRGYTQPISWRNLNNGIPDSVINTLLEVSKDNTSVFQRFFKLKAKLLKMDRLRRYDIYAPISEVNKKYEYDYAVKLVLDSFKEFDPKIELLAKRILNEQHIDSEVRPNKRSGAFCSSADPAISPFVHVSYNRQVSDITTLAHELGHAIHAMLAEHHNVFDFHSTLPLAETASTFSEMLLIDKLLEEETNDAVKHNILFQQVADSYATIMRQIYFALFEVEAHTLINNDASVDELNKAYKKNLALQFGDSVEISDEFEWEWVSIPHIYSYPFYVYAYSFGKLLVLSLYKQYKKEGESFIPRYLEILSSGGSASPIDILNKAGVDIHKPEFWQGGYDVISDMISQLEKL
jgi:oligoendopeptidase F